MDATDTGAAEAGGTGRGQSPDPRSGTGIADPALLAKVQRATTHVLKELDR